MSFSRRLDSSAELDFLDSSDIDPRALLVYGRMLDSYLLLLLGGLERDRGLGAFFSSKLQVDVSTDCWLGSDSVIFVLDFVGG